MDEDLKAKTARTAKIYFEGYPDERPFDLWRSFDKTLAKDLSLFITGQMYLSGEDPPYDAPTSDCGGTHGARKNRRTEAAYLRCAQCRMQPTRRGGGYFPMRNLRRNAHSE